MLRLCWSLALAVAVLGAVPADKVKSLPGYDGSVDGMYSGYISAPAPNGATAHVHYWLFLSPQSDAPIVAWQQGGPGSSSLIGLLTENGPLTLNDASFNTKAYNETGIPTVFSNPWGWHQAPAHYLYVEHPAPSGFSYCEGTCEWTDETQAVSNVEFYANFFKAYPELSHNEFYMTGESYAGVLVPTTALEILRRRESGQVKADVAPWSLKGFSLGNACPGNRVFTCTPYSGWEGTQISVDFYYGHGMISPELYQKVNEVCAGHWGTYQPPPEPCRSLLGDPVRPLMQFAGDTYQMGGGYFLYDSCDTDLDSPMSLQADTYLPSPHPSPSPRPDTQPAYSNDAGEYACGQERASLAWLQKQEVQEALNVRLVNKTTFSFSTSLHYNFTKFSLVDDYKNTILTHFRVMQYSGDADPCVPHVGTVKWIESMQLPVKQSWRPWLQPSSRIVAGYVVEYDLNNFTFATVRDAGHMVPRYKPKSAYHLFASWLHNKPL